MATIEQKKNNERIISHQLESGFFLSLSLTYYYKLWLVGVGVRSVDIIHHPSTNISYLYKTSFKMNFTNNLFLFVCLFVCEKKVVNERKRNRSKMMKEIYKNFCFLSTRKKTWRLILKMAS